MRTFVRSRNLGWMTTLSLVVVVVIFSPWGSTPTPDLGLGLTRPDAPLVPLRAIALVALGCLPSLTSSTQTWIHDLSGARSRWMLSALAPFALTVLIVAATALASTLTGEDTLGAMRNILLGFALTLVLSPIMGPLAVLPPVLSALFVAMLREQDAWWAVTNQPGTRLSLGVAMGLAAIALVGSRGLHSLGASPP